mmetsp:Transcript_3299/g.8686  ORF Transcript_3299/g.8686 Transcript_3299/m.8686 type:complete len:275 (+) Transcript_3299:360-1184(+)
MLGHEMSAQDCRAAPPEARDGLEGVPPRPVLLGHIIRNDAIREAERAPHEAAAHQVDWDHDVREAVERARKRHGHGHADPEEVAGNGDLHAPCALGHFRRSDGPRRDDDGQAEVHDLQLDGREATLGGEEEGEELDCHARPDGRKEVLEEEEPGDVPFRDEAQHLLSPGAGAGGPTGAMAPFFGCGGGRLDPLHTVRLLPQRLPVVEEEAEHSAGDGGHAAHVDDGLHLAQAPGIPDDGEGHERHDWPSDRGQRGDGGVVHLHVAPEARLDAVV